MADGWLRYLCDARVRLYAIALIRSPDDSKVKQKMLFASSKDALRRSLVGIAAEIQGTDFSEVAHESGTSRRILTRYRAALTLSCPTDLLVSVGYARQFSTRSREATEYGHPTLPTLYHASHDLFIDETQTMTALPIIHAG